METHHSTHRLRSDISSIRHLRAALTSIISERKVREDILNHIRLSFTEVMGNIIEHAYGEEEGEIEVEFLIEKSGLFKMTFKDQGKPAEEDELKPLTVDAFSESGRGLKLVHTLMDQVTFSQTRDTNILELQIQLEVENEKSRSKKRRQIDREIVEYFRLFQRMDESADMYSLFLERLSSRVRADIIFLFDREVETLHTHCSRNVTLDQVERISQEAFKALGKPDQVIRFTRGSLVSHDLRGVPLEIVDRIEVELDSGYLVLLKVKSSGAVSVDDRKFSSGDDLRELGIEMDHPDLPDQGNKEAGHIPRFFQHEREYVYKLTPLLDSLHRVAHLYMMVRESRQDRREMLDIFRELSPIFRERGSLEVVLSRLLEIALRIFQAEVGIIRVKSGEEQRSAQIGLDVGMLHFVCSGGRRLEEIIEHQQDILYLEQDQIDQAEEHNLVNLVASKISYENVSIGEVVLGNCREETFREEMSGLTFEIFLQLAAGVIENTLLHNEAIEKQKIENELLLARDIQSLLLPQKFPELGGFTFSGMSRPARNLGGDYYDVIGIGNDAALAVVADVSGKGVGPAILMAGLRGYLRAYVRMGLGPARLVEEINRILARETSDDKFVTALVAMAEPAKSSVTIVNAGHLPPLLLKRNGEIRRFEALSLPLGIMEGETFSETEVRMEKGDKLVIYTDGITEQGSMETRELGEDKWIEIVSTISTFPPDEFVQKITSRLDTFCKGTSLHDDQTLLVIQRE